MIFESFNRYMVLKGLEMLGFKKLNKFLVIMVLRLIKDICI